MSLESNASSSNRENHVAQPVRRKIAGLWDKGYAFFIWEKEGNMHGHTLDHWLHAESDVRRLVDAGKVRKQAW